MREAAPPPNETALDLESLAADAEGIGLARAGTEGVSGPAVGIGVYK